MIRVAFLCSGSKGNATLVSNGQSLLLFDMGASKQTLSKGCALFGKKIEDIDAAFFTHEHTDHVSGWRYLPSSITCYCSFPIDFPSLPIKPLDRVEFGSLTVTALSASHDAVNPLSYLIEDGGEKLAYVTDTGYIKKTTLKAIANCDYYLLESNHDPYLEAHSGRSARLVSRVLGRKGHLSNADSAKYFLKVFGDKTKAVYLGHLSEDCNTPKLALDAYLQAADEFGVSLEGIKIIPTSQRDVVLGGDWE